MENNDSAELADHRKLDTSDSDETSDFVFQISTGLKRVLGRELITNDEVAIFELVKNSFDAGAHTVTLFFGANRLAVIDDGAGMDADDIKNKWLFVAYSAKRSRETSAVGTDYRQTITEGRQFAGSKGVGRFSSDRLGKFLTLQTRSKTKPTGAVHRLEINWPEYELNDQAKFETILPTYSTQAEFTLPLDVAKLTHGTIIEISDLEVVWDREKLLKLKRGLAKLINPFGTGTDDFKINILAPEEKHRDEILRSKRSLKNDLDDEIALEMVNGGVENFIFRALENKTTFLSVEIDGVENLLFSTLIDRGEEIYKISETNPYPLLRGASFGAKLFYLNQSAKSTFTRRMGLEPVKFGSVFLFRNEFRVFPIGEEGDDYFGIDRRKQQGYSRFLGTRDLIARIDVSGDERSFQEASSRDQGLIQTPAVEELKRCFREHCLKRLERYVIPVSWKLANDKLVDTIEVISTSEGRARVSAAVAALVGSEDVELIRYSHKLIDVLEEKSESFQTTLGALKVIADRSDDDELRTRIRIAEQRFLELKAVEEEALRLADDERKAKRAAEDRARAAEADVVIAKEELVEERKRNLFLTSLATLDAETLNNLHHQITIYSTSLHSLVAGLIERISKKQPLTPEQMVTHLESIALYNTKIHAIARFATKANFRMASEYIEENLSEFIAGYVTEIAMMYTGNGLTVFVNRDGKPAKKKFKPIDMAIVIDNLVSNSGKAGASSVTFNLRIEQRNVLIAEVTDDGSGVDPSLLQDDRLFEKGVSKTDGSGLGLYHVRQVLGQMGATIGVSRSSATGTTFIIQIPL